MYRLRTKGGKRDLEKNWALPDKVFFACGACHILAFAFLTRYPNRGFTPIWIRPKQGYTGNHIVAVLGPLAFDYHGYSDWTALHMHMKKRANQWWPGWDADLIQLPQDVLISETKSRMYEGLWLREPTQFRFDALLRAQAFLGRFPTPPELPNKSDAPNPAIAPRFQVGHPWRGVGEPDRSEQTCEA